MRLTRSELLAAAKRARVYPKGYGYQWGYGPLAVFDFPEQVAEHAHLASYGWPVVAATAVRGDFSGERMAFILGEMIEHIGDYSNDYDYYPSILNHNPRAVARALLALARAASPGE